MRVSLFGLFLRCTSLMGPWLKCIQSILLVIYFTLDFRFYDAYVIPVHIYFTCVLTLLSSVLDTCAHPGSPPGIVPYSPGEFHWLPWILMSRSWSPERVDFPRYCSEWRSGSVDIQPTFQSSILPGPLCASRVFSWVPFFYSYLYFSLYTRMWAPFYTVHICISFVLSHLRISDIILL